MISFINLFKMFLVTSQLVQVTRGTIGGIVIQENSIVSANGLFSVTSDGQINAKSGYVGGFSLADNYMSSPPASDGSYFALNPASNYIAFIHNNSNTWSGIGKNVLPGTSPHTAVARFQNHQPNSGNTNIGIIASAAGASQNIALDIQSGGIRVNGSMGATTYELVSSSGPQTRKYINGIYIGIGPNGSW